MARFRNLAEELCMKLCSATHSALLPEVTSFIVVNKREQVFAPQQFQSRLTHLHIKLNLIQSQAVLRGYSGRSRLSSWQWCPWARNTWPMLAIFSIVCSKVFQNRFLQNINAPSPTVNIAHIRVGKRAILAQQESWLSCLRLSPLNYHRQGIFFHKYFKVLNTAVNTSYAWVDNTDYGLNKHTMCTVLQSTAQLFRLSPQCLLNADNYLNIY